MPEAGNFLNKLTVREFERVCSDAGFEFARREFHPFSMPQPLKAISALGTKLPGPETSSPLALYMTWSQPHRQRLTSDLETLRRQSEGRYACRRHGRQLLQARARVVAPSIAIPTQGLGPGQRYDVITIPDVIEHIDDPTDFSTPLFPS